MSVVSKLKAQKTIFYVYALLDPRKPGKFRYGKWVFSHEPFYVGKGHGTRYNSHFIEVELGIKNHKTNKIRKIIREAKN